MKNMGERTFNLFIDWNLLVPLNKNQTEGKATVVTAGWGTELNYSQDDMKKKMNGRRDALKK